MDKPLEAKSKRKQIEAKMVKLAVDKLDITLSAKSWPAFLDEYFEHAENINEAKKVQPDAWGVIDGMPIIIEAVNSHGVAREKMRVFSELDCYDETAIAIINKNGIVTCENPFILYTRMVYMGTY